jgi:5-formyltetrahydrofolate cyclo-ligase
MEGEMQQSKSNLRIILREYRNSYSDKNWAKISDSIQNQAFKLIQELGVSRIGCYVQSKKSREISTDSLIQNLLKSDLTVCTPVIGENYSMKMIRITSITEFEINKWGIPEPSSLDEVTIPESVIVPMMGGDIYGGRIGYGKGYYDRYLTINKVIKIGFCPEACVVHEIPKDDYDVTMDFIITENGIVRKNAK